MTADGPTPDDFAAAARTEARVASTSTLACVALLVAAVVLIALGTLTPTRALVGAFLVAVLVVFPCGAWATRRSAALLPSVAPALTDLVRRSPDATGSLVLCAWSRPGGGRRTAPAPTRAGSATHTRAAAAT